jgi:CRISPR-associated protein Csb2
VPWTDVLLLPLDRAVPEKDRVGLAVATHRALIAAIGDGAPPVVTGFYPEGSSRPANRLAIQVVDAAMPVDLPAAMAGTPAVLALLLPSDAVPADVAVLLGALSTLRSVRGRGGVVRRVTARPEAMSGSAFWRPPAPGTLRRWRTSPPALPDTRGLRNGAWTFAHAALLSLGYVWKDRLELPPSRGEQRQVAVVAAVQAADVAVVSTVPVRESDVRPYVHKVHPHAVVRPYRADLWLGDLAPARCVQAIGQTRHLGGGLLVPADSPTEAQQ